MNQISKPLYRCLYPADSTDARCASWIIQKLLKGKNVVCEALDYTTFDASTLAEMAPFKKPVVALFSQTSETSKPLHRLYFDHLTRPYLSVGDAVLCPNWKHGAYYIGRCGHTVSVVEKEWTADTVSAGDTHHCDGTMSALVWDYFFGLAPKPFIVSQLGNIANQDAIVAMLRHEHAAFDTVHALLDLTLYDNWDMLTEAQVSLKTAYIDPKFCQHYADKAGQANATLATMILSDNREWAWIVVPRIPFVIGGIDVKLISIPYEISVGVKRQLAAECGSSFTGHYWDFAASRRFELWSHHKHGLDVGAIARKYGGAGHKNFAMFTMPRGWGGDAKSVFNK